jgi:hypothetical protein
VISGSSLLYGTAKDVHPRAQWHDSFTGAIQHAIAPTLASPVLLPALVFAGFAALLPLLVRGRAIGLELVLGGAWAVGLVAALSAIDGLMDGKAQLPSARGEMVGTLLGVAVAIGLARVRTADQTPRPLTGLS